MTTPIEYRSTDTSAPVIDGTAGALANALYAILDTGYGSKDPAGWTRDFVGANKAVFRQGGGNQHYLRIDDSDARLSRVKGFRTMSDVDTGTVQFPTETQLSGGNYMRKSVSADATARPWICLATESSFYLIIFGNQTTLGNFDGGDSHLGVGLFRNARPKGDRLGTFILGATDTSATSTTASAARQVITAFATGATASHSIVGTANNLPVPQNVVKHNMSVYGDIFVASNSGHTTHFPAYPDVNGKLDISEIRVVGRGTYPGIWCLCHPYTSFTTLDTFSGTGVLAGRTFLIVKTGTAGIVFETTGDGWA